MQRFVGSQVSLPSMAASASLDVYLDTLGEHTVSVKVPSASRSKLMSEA